MSKIADICIDNCYFLLQKDWKLINDIGFVGENQQLELAYMHKKNAVFGDFDMKNKMKLEFLIKIWDV